METLFTLIWLLAVLLAVFAVHWSWGMAGLTRMFPEGYRPWQTMARGLTLGAYTLVILLNPWSCLGKHLWAA